MRRATKIVLTQFVKALVIVIGGGAAISAASMAMIPTSLPHYAMIAGSHTSTIVISPVMENKNETNRRTNFK